MTVKVAISEEDYEKLRKSWLRHYKQEYGWTWSQMLEYALRMGIIDAIAGED